MTRILFALAVAGICFAAIPETVRAAPVAPLPSNAIQGLQNLTDVAWRRCWRDRWGRLHCRACWRDRWGRVRCR